ncbi:MAG: hypothetical protein ACKOCM_11975 [Cyanobacteriota bacterium]
MKRSWPLLNASRPRGWPVSPGCLLGGVLALMLLVLGLQPAVAAEVLQVRSATMLQIGDGNRSYPVRLACLEVAAEDQQQAQQWLRARLPRQTRVNLRPIGAQDGTLVARVTPLARAGLAAAAADPIGTDLSSGLIAAQLASPARGASC